MPLLITMHQYFSCPTCKQGLYVQLLTKASNLFSAVTKGRLVSSATAAASLTSNLKNANLSI